MGIAFPVTVKMVKTTICLVLLSLLYQAHAAPQDAAAAENELETTVAPAADAAAEPAADAAAEPAAAAAEPAPVAKLGMKAQEMLENADKVVVAKLNALSDCPTKIGTAAELLLQISAAMISCRTAPDTDAPAPEAPVEVEGFPVDKALMADAEVTEVLAFIRRKKCASFKRTLLAIMVNKKVVDATVSCQEEMTKVVDKDDGKADAAAEPAAEPAADAAAEPAAEAPAA